MTANDVASAEDAKMAVEARAKGQQHLKRPSLDDEIASVIMNLGDEADSPWSGKLCFED